MLIILVKVFRHYKGNYYFIENISMDSETKEDMIVYRPLYERKDSMLWNRPAKMFFEEIDPNKKIISLVKKTQI